MLTDKFNEDFAPAWRPMDGETIEGEITSIDVRTTEHGPYPIVTIQTDGAVHAVHAFHKSLREPIVDRKPEIGDRLAIKYEGTRTAKGSGREYHLYRVVFEKPKAVDWGALGDGGGEEVKPDIPVDDDLPWSDDFKG